MTDVPADFTREQAMLAGRTIMSIEFEPIANYGCLTWVRLTLDNGTIVQIASYASYEDSELVVTALAPSDLIR